MPNQLWTILLSTIWLSLFHHTAQAENFDQWLVKFKQLASQKGIKSNTLNSALEGIQYDKKIIDLDRKQPESTVTFSQYIDRRVSKAIIKKGKKYINKNREALLQVSEHYQVEAEVIAAIWGAESNYGTFPLKYDVIQSLATLAYDRRRREYFTGELIAALKILDAKYIERKELKGSWAGALGQPQFMPSNYLKLAQDFDQDGRKDIWKNPLDVFASIAFYLRKHGWQAGKPWAVQVKLPKTLGPESPHRQKNATARTRALRSHTASFDMAVWHKLGLKTINSTIEAEALTASLYIPKDSGELAFLTYPNYRSILKYNASNYYAMSISMLADELRPFITIK